VDQNSGSGVRKTGEGCRALPQRLWRTLDHAACLHDQGSSESNKATADGLAIATRSNNRVEHAPYDPSPCCGSQTSS
jgi:hypothetical protein